MQSFGITQSHSSLIIDVPLNVNQKPAADLINAIISNANLPTSTEMRNYLNLENVVWRPPISIIRSLNLPNFTPQNWMALSRREYATEAQRADQTALYEVLLLYAITYTPTIIADAAIPTFFIGDFDEVSRAIEIVVSPDFQRQYIDWKALVPDPYKPNQLNVSEIFPLYDRYVNDKWLVGPETTGLPTNVNLQWLKVSTATNQLVVGAKTRLNYFDDSPAAILDYARLCLAVLAACQNGTTAILKITLPTNNGIYGIYSLFSLFFASTRLVKTRHSPPDDTTAYLIGIDAQPISLEILNLLVDDNQLVKTLAILSSNTSRNLDQDLNRLFKDPMELHIDKIFKL